MFKWVSKIVFCLILLFSLQVNAKTAEIISLAEQSRPDSTLSREQENLRIKSILSETSGLLPHYEVKDRMEDSIKDFVKNSLSEENVFEFSVVNTRTTEFYGKSHDIVFLIQNKEGKVLYIVKAFQKPCEPAGEFLSEISAMELVIDMEKPLINPIRGVAFGILHEGSNTWGLLLETAAPGKRLDQYISAEKFETAKKVFRSFGASLAYLHSVKSAEKKPLNPARVTKFDEKVSRALKEPFVVEEITKRVSMSQFLAFVEKVKRQAQQQFLYYTYSHGDTNLGNVFYDEVSETVSYIDLHSLHESVDILGQPISDNTIDLVRAEDSIRKKAANLLSPEEIEALIASFYTAYEEIGGPLPDKVHFAFYKTYISISRMILGSHYMTEQDPVRREFDKAAFEEGLDYITREINKNN